MLPFSSSDLPAVLPGKHNCCLILLRMRFTSQLCYQSCGSLLHCLFTLTRLATGGNISVALSVTRWAMQKNCSCQFVPGYYPAFFPKEPGLSLTTNRYHQRFAARLYSICYLLTNFKRITLHPLLHQNRLNPRLLKTHHPHPLNPQRTRSHLHHTLTLRVLRHLQDQDLRP